MVILQDLARRIIILQHSCKTGCCIRDRMVILQDLARRIIILQHSYKISHINLALSEAKLNKVIV